MLFSNELLINVVVEVWMGSHYNAMPEWEDSANDSPELQNKHTNWDLANHNVIEKIVLTSPTSAIRMEMRFYQTLKAHKSMPILDLNI